MFKEQLKLLKERLKKINNGKNELEQSENMKKEIFTSYIVNFKLDKNTLVPYFAFDSITYCFVDWRNQEITDCLTGKKVPIIYLKKIKASDLDINGSYVVSDQIQEVRWDSLSKDEYDIIFKNYKAYKSELANNFVKKI